MLVIILIIAVVAYLAICVWQQKVIAKLKKKITWDSFQRISEQQAAEDKLKEACLRVDKALEVNRTLRHQLEFFSIRVDRLSKIVKELRSRQITYSIALTKDKTPDTDIRVNQYQAREELALELQKQGAITYIVSEKYRPEFMITEITVTASINTLKLK